MKKVYLVTVLTLIAVIGVGGLAVYDRSPLPDSVEINCTIPELVKGPFPMLETEFIPATPEMEEEFRIMLDVTEDFELRSQSHLWDMKYMPLNYYDDTEPSSYWAAEADKFMEKIRPLLPVTPLRLELREVKASQLSIYDGLRVVRGKSVHYDLIYGSLPLRGPWVSNYIDFSSTRGGTYAVSLPVVWETGETTVTVTPKEALKIYYDEFPTVDIIETIELCYYYNIEEGSGPVPLCYKVVGGFGSAGHYHPETRFIPATG